MYRFKDKVLSCTDCGREFLFTAGEQMFYADKGLHNDPKRCKICKTRKNQRVNSSLSGYGYKQVRGHVESSVTCALCGIETTVPFQPSQGRPVYCRDCFLRMRASEESVHPPVF